VTQKYTIEDQNQRSYLEVRALFFGSSVQSIVGIGQVGVQGDGRVHQSEVYEVLIK
jgi:hypothetical protein